MVNSVPNTIKITDRTHKDLNLQLTESNIDLIAEMHGSIYALLLLDLFQMGQLSKVPKVTIWKQAETQDALHGDLWLLSYEAGVRGWAGFTDTHIQADSHFNALRVLGVRFYDQAATLKPIFHVKSIVGKNRKEFDLSTLFDLDEVDDFIEFDESDGGYEGVVIPDDDKKSEALEEW
ncbi:MAG: hypothetical protein HHJ09_05965 [Glaciimonas sp.]|nr:hypothetical protein [Glaciimonas sp.]